MSFRFLLCCSRPADDSRSCPAVIRTLFSMTSPDLCIFMVKAVLDRPQVLCSDPHQPISARRPVCAALIFDTLHCDPDLCVPYFEGTLTPTASLHQNHRLLLDKYTIMLCHMWHSRNMLCPGPAVMKTQLLTAQIIIPFSKFIVYLTNIKTEDTIMAAIVYFCTLSGPLLAGNKLAVWWCLIRLHTGQL